MNHSDLIASSILNGVERTTPKGHAFMPGFGGKAHDINALNDGQVATLANYVIDHYGRAGTPVTPADVTEIRAGGPTSPVVLLAQIGIGIGIGIASVAGLGVLPLIFRREARKGLSPPLSIY